MSLSPSKDLLSGDFAVEPLYTITSDSEVLSPKPIRRISFDGVIRVAAMLEITAILRNLTTKRITTANDDLLAGSVPEYQMGRGGQFGAIGSGRLGVIGGERRRGEVGL